MANGNGQPRTYSIAGDTATGALNRKMLKAAIEADAGITTALRTKSNGGWQSSDGDVMDLWFVSQISGSQITALDAAVLAHQGVSTVRDFQFWEINASGSTVSQAWQNAISKTSVPLKAGVYKISWSLELRVAPIGPENSGAVARVRVNSSRKKDYYHPHNKWSGFGDWDRIIFKEGDTPLIEIDWRRDPDEGGNDKIEIRKLKLGIEFMGT